MADFGFQWHITDRCNLRCRHCYQESFSADSEAGLDCLKTMADRIFSAIPSRAISVNVTGGEPLLLPYLFDLVRHLSRFENLHRIHIITNATVANDGVVESIRAADKIGYLKVSVEAAGEAQNDSLRGKGSFSRALEGIAAYRRAGKDVVLMITLGGCNAGEIEGVAKLARRLGAAGVIFERFVPLGNGLALARDSLDTKGWAEAVSAIARAAGIEAQPDELLPYRAFWLWTDGRTEDVLDGALCNLGDQSMALMPDGTVYPCRRLPVPVGNVLSEPFDEILARLRKFSVQAIRPHLRGGTCGLCGIDDCAGCRALARAATGDLLADDPQCVLRE
jgi:radical SAM protein with 4Fe4S-binding SPASM domain